MSLELRYLMLMSCVDAMDGEKIGQLKERTTAAMLGVSPDAARLFNGMRNKLTHRALGHRQAFARVINEDVEQRVLCFEPELQSFLQGGRELDFLQVWLRLCERLDAFWCSYIGVPVSMVKNRYSLLALMPPIDPSALPAAIALLTTSEREKVEKAESETVRQLRDQVSRLSNELCECKLMFVDQGKKYADLKSKYGMQGAQGK